MGIDDVIRRYAPRKPIALECERCGTTEGAVKCRTHWYQTDLEAVLCAACWSAWVPPPK